MSARLLHTGQAIVDLAMGVEVLPPPGGDVFAHRANFEVGGGFNVMAAARRMGMEVVYLGRHGTGVFGDLVRGALTHEGIAFSAPPTQDIDTGICVAVTDGTGERTFVTHVGAEKGMSLEELTVSVPVAEDFVYVSGYSLFYPEKFQALEAWLPALPGGAGVVFDPGPLPLDASSDFSAFLGRVTLLSSNRTEALRLTGASDIPMAVAALLPRLAGGARVLVRDGAAGCWVGDERQTVPVPGFPAAPVDTNGAGDAHTGVFIAGLADGLCPVEAARRANAAAAIAITREGPATSPRLNELEAFVAIHHR